MAEQADSDQKAAWLLFVIVVSATAPSRPTQLVLARVLDVGEHVQRGFVGMCMSIALAVAAAEGLSEQLASGSGEITCGLCGCREGNMVRMFVAYA